LPSLRGTDRRRVLSSLNGARCAPFGKSVAAPDDLAGGALVGGGLLAFGLPPPGRDRVRISLTGLALPAAVRVVDGVHHDAADRRADAAPALGAGLAV